MAFARRGKSENVFAGVATHYIATSYKGAFGVFPYFVTTIAAGLGAFRGFWARGLGAFAGIRRG
jgi:hypothetical protein